MKIKKQLEYFYDQEASKYYSTRKKYRKEGNIVLDEIKKHKNKTISILEFGCGSGRLISFLKENLKGKKINYIGVDLSKNLIKYAQKDNPNNIFIHDDISNYVKKIDQESIDFVIGIASFQHISTKQERMFLMKNFYKILKYEGKVIMTNRSISKRFIKKHFKVLAKSFLRSVYTLGMHNIRDLYIPWENNKIKYLRYYHIFSKKELENISKMSGFKSNILKYVDKTGHYIDSWYLSSNSIYIGEKNI